MSDDRVSAFRFPMLVTASTYAHHVHSTALKELKKRLGVCDQRFGLIRFSEKIYFVIFLVPNNIQL
jgi:hypothetical protein